MAPERPSQRPPAGFREKLGWAPLGIKKAWRDTVAAPDRNKQKSASPRTPQTTHVMLKVESESPVMTLDAVAQMPDDDMEDPDWTDGNQGPPTSSPASLASSVPNIDEARRASLLDTLEAAASRHMQQHASASKQHPQLKTPTPSGVKSSPVSNSSAKSRSKRSKRKRRLRHESLKDMYPDALRRFNHEDGVLMSSPEKSPKNKTARASSKKATTQPKARTETTAVPAHRAALDIFRSPPRGQTLEDRIKDLERKASGNATFKSQTAADVEALGKRLDKLERQQAHPKHLGCEECKDLKMIVSEQQAKLDQLTAWASAAQIHGLPLPRDVLERVRRRA